jgi:hypothetical protein
MLEMKLLLSMLYRISTSTGGRRGGVEHFKFAMSPVGLKCACAAASALADTEPPESPRQTPPPSRSKSLRHQISH